MCPDIIWVKAGQVLSCFFLLTFALVIRRREWVCEREVERYCVCELCVCVCERERESERASELCSANRVVYFCNFYQCLGLYSVLEIFLFLTPSLPWCHLKMTSKSVKLKLLEHFCFLFHSGTWKEFHKMHSIECGCVTGPKSRLFAGASMHLSAWKFYRLGQWRG